MTDEADEADEAELLIAQLRRALSSAAAEARRWKHAYEHLAGQPSPGAYDLGKQLAATRVVLQASIAQKNRAVDAARKAKAFRFGMDQRLAGLSLTKLKDIDCREAVTQGWIYMDNAIAKRG